MPDGTSIAHDKNRPLNWKEFTMENNQNIESTPTDFSNRDKVRSDALEVMDKAKTVGREQLESGKQTTASQAEKIADVIEHASSRLEENNLQTLADYASEIGTTIKNFSEGLHNRSVDDLVVDIRDIARRNPTAFLLGSIVIGVGISRFFKASPSVGTSRI
jgi:gas vesicle protein